MRTGNANRRLGVSVIFHSKFLNNDGRRRASSPLVGGANWKKFFVAQVSSYI
jgi:hypothetical protein